MRPLRALRGSLHSLFDMQIVRLRNPAELLHEGLLELGLARILGGCGSDASAVKGRGDRERRRKGKRREEYAI